MFVCDDYSEFTEYVIRLLKDTNLRRTVCVRARALGERFDHKNAAKVLHEVILDYHGH